MKNCSPSMCFSWKSDCKIFASIVAFVTRKYCVIDFYKRVCYFVGFLGRRFQTCKKILMGAWGFETVILSLPTPHNFLCLLLFTLAGNLLPVTNLGIMEVSKWIDIVGLTYDISKQNVESSKICSRPVISSLWYRMWKMKRSELKL